MTLSTASNTSLLTTWEPEMAALGFRAGVNCIAATKDNLRATVDEWLADDDRLRTLATLVVGELLDGRFKKKWNRERRNDCLNIAAPRCNDPVDRVERHDLPRLHRHTANNGVAHRLNDAEGARSGSSRLHARDKLFKRE
jgi:hypothetical protein